MRLAVVSRIENIWAKDDLAFICIDGSEPTCVVGAGDDLRGIAKTRFNIWCEYTRPASRQREMVEEKFERLANLWREETAFQSSIHSIALHPAYQEIIGMGWDAVPLMLRCLNQGPEHWFWALRSITGVSPIKEADRGKMDAMAQAWVRWGKDKGYL